MLRNQSTERTAWVRVIAVLCFTVFGTSPAMAQADSSESQDQWQYSGAIYLWGADIGGQTIGGSEVEGWGSGDVEAGGGCGGGVLGGIGRGGWGGDGLIG